MNTTRSRLRMVVAGAAITGALGVAAMATAGSPANGVVSPGAIAMSSRFNDEGFLCSIVVRHIGTVTTTESQERGTGGNDRWLRCIKRGLNLVKSYDEFGRFDCRGKGGFIYPFRRTHAVKSSHKVELQCNTDGKFGG